MGFYTRKQKANAEYSGRISIENGGEMDVESGGVMKIAGTAVTASAAELNKLDDSGAVIASGTQADFIADPTGGDTQDAEARASIAAILDALAAFGIMAESAE